MRIGISEARARLPELVRYVAEQDGAVVVIENRRMEEAVVLTSEKHMRSLEVRVKELEKKVAGGFQLKGSLVTDMSDDALTTALEQLRADQAAADLERLGRLVP